MIVFLKGEVLEISQSDKNSYVDLMTGDGVGYRIFVSAFEAGQFIRGDNAQFYTSFQVREDSQALYGFAELKTRSLFERLIDISGIGPKVAMSVLSTFALEELENLLIAGDYKALSKASGLGQKGAKKIILELQGKLELGDDSDKVSSKNTRRMPIIIEDLSEAMQSLGFKGAELEKKLLLGEKIYNEQKDISIEELLGRVLKS